MLARLAFFLFLLLAWPVQAAVDVHDVRLGLQAGGQTRFVLELGRDVDFRLFVLDAPRRIVLDLPALNWLKPADALGKGVVKGWRTGQFGTGTRIVLDLAAPVTIHGGQMIPPRDGKGARLVLDLALASPETFSAQIGRNWGGRPEQKLQHPSNERSQAAATPLCPLPPEIPDIRRMDRKPMIAIDAGHGGVDPGARAITGHNEKDITLAVARRLAGQIEASGRYRVFMTREKDVFIPLQERVRLARAAGADLFISLHADSIRDRSIRGATVYTLSDRASDREAAELAESENRSDELAGLPGAGQEDTVASILSTMSYRASVNSGRAFAGLMVTELRRQQVALNDVPQRSAGFAVLKAPDIPSVLLEMGYLTSRADASLLVSAGYQRKLTSALLRALDNYFSHGDLARRDEVAALTN